MRGFLIGMLWMLLSNMNAQTTGPGGMRWIRGVEVILQDIDADHPEVGKLLAAQAGESGMKVKCFTNGDAYFEFHKWKKDQDIIAMFSGGYADQEDMVGLTMQEGIVQSKSLANRMDGLFVNLPNGQVEIFNTAQCLDLQKLCEKQSFCLHQSALDRRDFLAWSQERQLTFFQSHLLAFNQKLRITPEASPFSSERRVFIIAEKEEVPYYLLADIQKSLSLFEGSRMLVQVLSEYEIKAMINLDVGVYDIFRMYDLDGQELFNLRKGSLLKANNLIVMYRDSLDP